MKFPEFIIVGVTKGGTTALWYNLDKHPGINMATKSSSSLEMNFFGGITRKKGIEWYKTRFSGEVCGEKSTLYCQHNGAIKNIKKYMPDVKLILCVRNPVDRAYSNWQMNYRGGEGRIKEKFSFNLFKRRYSATGKYINLIEEIILPYFDKSELYICVSEHMKKDMTGEMKKVFEYIGVDDLNLPSKEIIYMKGRTRQEDIIANREEKFYRVWSKFTDRLTGPLRKEVLEYYKPYNERLFNYFGYEIEEWKR